MSPTLELAAGILYRLFLPLKWIWWSTGYVLVMLVWLVGWWPVWVLTGKNIMAKKEAPFRWMDNP